jgi:hypothetical protein
MLGQNRADSGSRAAFAQQDSASITVQEDADSSGGCGLSAILKPALIGDNRLDRHAVEGEAEASVLIGAEPALTQLSAPAHHGRRALRILSRGAWRTA